MIRYFFFTVAYSSEKTNLSFLNMGIYQSEFPKLSILRDFAKSLQPEIKHCDIMSISEVSEADYCVLFPDYKETSKTVTV